ncbi:(S)-benzoin forming benzil reductase [Aquibacillus sediminis]|uniref:(S)-benzoin forming benzil reductase n=1 Tax=Aquibacillus sediminis TaxID=2574734 RepID=UPI001108DC9D|nr:(S)-benzoin forming benzil reductase [Aquibacillus sediminis]
MKYAIVTGASKGLGASIANLLMENEIHVIGVARSTNQQLEQQAQLLGVTYHHYPCDLSNPQEVENVFQKIAEQVFTEGTNLVYLVNNAGALEPMKPAGEHNLDDLTNHVHINLLTPMATTNLFIQQANNTGIPVLVANVTSGAAKRPIYGWSAYSSTKMGLNRYSETVALEQDEIGTHNKVILFDPGRMDTDMQVHIRSTSEDDFKDVEQYKQAKQEGSLRHPNIVANALVRVLLDEQGIENGKLYLVKDYV